MLMRLFWKLCSEKNKQNGSSAHNSELCIPNTSENYKSLILNKNGICYHLNV
jgi:hypothetical protein